MKKTANKPEPLAEPAAGTHISTEIASGESIVIKGFKGFDKDLKCQSMQYALNSEFEMEKSKKLKCCPTHTAREGGLHFCENPLDVFGYYPPGTSRYAEVEGMGEIDKKGDDSKVACTRLKIGGEIKLKAIIEGGIKFIFERVKWTKENTTHKDGEGATSNGYSSGATSNGNSSGATSNGYSSGATSNGYSSGATSNGYSSGATSNGNSSGATSNGNRSGATCCGDDASAATVKGGVATVIGKNCQAKGKIGAWLVITEGDYDKNNDFFIKDLKAVIVDGEAIKADTFYKLIAGILVEQK